MEIGTSAAWAAVLIALASLLNSWLSARSKASADAHKDLEKRVTETETELARMQRDVEHLPDAAATHRQELMIQEIKGKMDVLSERLKPVAEISNRLQEFLLEQARGK